MKKLILISGLLFFLCSDAFAQNIDSATYQRQRQKINSMLAVRSQKFSKYDQSLSEHTGIFGLQTKKDIRRSNDILMDIVKTDNEIYQQLKILLDYRVFQQEQAIDKSKEAEVTALESMYTINRLQKQLEKLKKEQDAKDIKHDQALLYFKISVFILVLIILFILSRQIRRKDKF
jgi:predicted transcriptional regulator